MPKCIVNNIEEKLWPWSFTPSNISQLWTKICLNAFPHSKKYLKEKYFNDTAAVHLVYSV